MKTYYVVCRGHFEGLGRYATREEAEKVATVRNIVANQRIWTVKEIKVKED